MICEAAGLEYEHSDKVDHFVVGGVVGFVSAAAVDHLMPDAHPAARFVVALIPVVVLAIGKEVVDHQDADHHTSDWRDAAATVAGGVIAIPITFRF